MRRFFLASFFLCLFASSARSQGGFTTVTGTVTDPNGVKWACATISAQLITAGGAAPTLNGGGFTTQTSPVALGCPTLPGTGASGSFVMRLADSGVISPSNTTWRFTVNTTGNAPPLGTGPQSFTFTTAINCSTNTPSTCTSNQLDISTQLSALAPALGGGGSPTPVPGSLISFGRTVSPFAFGAKWDGKAISDAAATNGLSTYTCPNADCGFTSVDLGKLIEVISAPASATPPCIGAGCGVIVAQGFVCTINSASSIVIGSTFPGCAPVAAAQNCATSSNGNCNMTWATQDDAAAINAAAQAAWNNGNQCLPLELPGGIAFFSSGILNVTVNAGSPCAGFGGGGNGPGFADFSQTGPVVYGQGAGATILVPFNFNFAGCTFGSASNACNLATQALIPHDFQISGMGDSGNGTTHNVMLTELRGVSGPCTSTNLYNVSFNQWQAASTGTIGLNYGGGCFVTNINNIVMEAFGTQTANIGGNITNLNGDEFFGAGGAGGLATLVAFNQAGTVNSTSSVFANVVSSGSGSQAILMSGGNTWNSFADTVTLGSNTQANGLVIRCTNNCNINASGSTFTNNNVSSGASSLFTCTAGNTCNLKAYASNLAGAGTVGKFVSSPGTFNYFDACGNILTNGSVASTGTFNIYGSCSVTGTNVAASNLVLSAGWGNTPAAAWTALTGTTQYVQGTITAGTAALAANPTITYTFPTPFPLSKAPAACQAWQVGGTQAAVANPFTPSALSATGVTFTYNGTPGASATFVVTIQCWNP